MLKHIIIIISMLYACQSQAGSGYQVDMILFTHPQNGVESSELDADSPMIPISKSAIPLKNDSSRSVKPYHILSPSKSSLRDQYYLLNRKHEYRILAHYSWIQPKSNQSSVALPKLNKNGWQMQGTVQITQGSYYTLDAELQLSPPDSPRSSFTVVQKQRLQGNVVYYLDHRRLGMLIKIHRIG